MIDTLNTILPYITGLYTLPWILIGFIITLILTYFIDEQKINTIMKKVGLILLYFFVPLLLFRIFLDRDFNTQNILFTIVSSIIIVFMYILAYLYARYTTKKQHLTTQQQSQYIKTVLTNQGRSSAFIGGALLASPWYVEAAIFIALIGIALFAVIPYILAYMHKKETHRSQEHIQALPLYLKIYPWYLISFVFLAIILHTSTGITMNDLGEPGIVLKFYTALTIPAALYYVGAGIHPHDLKLNEMKKLFSLKKPTTKDHWPWIRTIFFLTVILTPLIITCIFAILLMINAIPTAWFAVIIINSFLPITSTNMFLIPYGIDKKATALAVTWTTIFCVPLIVFLIYLFTIFLP